MVPKKNLEFLKLSDHTFSFFTVFLQVNSGASCIFHDCSNKVLTALLEYLGLVISNIDQAKTHHVYKRGF